MKIPERSRVGDEKYRYAYQGQEKDPETGKEAFQLRLWDGRIGRWLRPDPKGEFVSPYLGMGNNPIIKIDPDGGSTDHHIYLNAAGDVTKFVEMEGANKFFDQNGVELFFGDAANLDIHMMWGRFEAGDNIYTPIHNLHEIVINEGTIRPNVTASNKESYDFIKLGVNSYFPPNWGKSWDFPYVLKKMFKVSNDEMNKAGYYGGSRTYFRFGKHNTIYNIYDAGQFIWGRAVAHSGFTLDTALLGSDINEGVTNGEGDSAADIKAIINGFNFQYHNKKVKGWD